jgi:hypothetical protein
LRQLLVMLAMVRSVAHLCKYLLMLYYEGNFHALVLYADDTELALVREAVSRINHKAIELEGTCECLSLVKCQFS